MDWAAKEAEDRLEEIAEKALQEGPQRIVQDDDVVVLISEDEYRLLKAKRAARENDFIEYLKSCPSLEGVDISRDRSPMREIEW